MLVEKKDHWVMIGVTAGAHQNRGTLHVQIRHDHKSVTFFSSRVSKKDVVRVRS